MRIVFMGTPEFAVPPLRALLQHHDVALVVSQPDRPAGRGMSLRRSPAAEVAKAAAVDLEVPASIRSPEMLERIRAAQPDLLVVAAYGRILPPQLLEAAPLGALNVHASLLPRWRGASPIAAAILAGDEETGVSIMRMDEGLDTGPVLLQRPMPIEPNATTGELTRRLARLGADSLIESLRSLGAGTSVLTPQDQLGGEPTTAPLVRKSDGDLEWSLPASHIERAVRAYDPWPGVRLQIEGGRVRVLKARALPPWTAARSGGSPGDVLEVGPAGVTVQTGNAPLLLEVVQAPGRRAMAAVDYARGRRGLVGRDG